MPTRYCGASGAEASTVSVNSLMARSLSCRPRREAAQQHLDRQARRDIALERLPGLAARRQPGHQIMEGARPRRTVVDTVEHRALPTCVGAQEIAIAEPAGF